MKYLLLFIILFSSNLYSQNNIIQIIIDDLGYTGLSVSMDGTPNGMSDYYYTPRIAALANQSVIFSNCYSEGSYCTPSRASMLTGEHNYEHGVTSLVDVEHQDRLVDSFDVNFSREGLPIFDHISYKLKDSDYLTGYYGRWNHAAEPDSYLYDYSETYIYDDNNNGLTINPKRSDQVNQGAKDFMNYAVSVDSNFYLTISYYSVHARLGYTQADLDTMSQFPVGIRHANIEYAANHFNLDTYIGDIIDHIESLGLTDETYIVFVSDNGVVSPAAIPGSNALPYRDYKGSMYEGALKIPLFIAGPGINHRYDTTFVRNSDIFFSVLNNTIKCCGLNRDLISQARDGNTYNYNVPHIVHNPHYLNTHDPSSVVIWEGYKLIINHEGQLFELYNLYSDPFETTDLSTTNPAKVLEYQIIFRDALKRAGRKMAYPNFEVQGQFHRIKGDADLDRLPDWWEMDNLLSIKFGPGEDIDGDGFTNLEEYYNCTDPLKN